MRRISIGLLVLLVSTPLVMAQTDVQKFDAVVATDGSGIEQLEGSKITAGDIAAARMTANAVVVGDFGADGDILVGTGAGTFIAENGATARTSLGLTIGSDVQAYSANLDQLAVNNGAALTNLFGTAGGSLLVEWSSDGVTSFLYTVSEAVPPVTNKVGQFYILP